MNSLYYLSHRPIVGRKEEVPMFFGGLLFLAGLALWMFYIATLPIERDGSRGHTYPLREHGKVVYATLGQTLLVNGMIAGGWVLAGGGVLWEMRNDSRKKAS